MRRLLFVFSLIGILHARSMRVEEDMEQAHWGISIVDLATGLSLVAHNDHKLFTPASVNKLLTTAGILEAMGADATFRTCVYLTPSGDLVLQGSSDPSLTSDALRVLANQVANAGITIVPTLWIDESKLPTRLVPHAECDDLTWYYAPELSALSVDENAVRLIVDGDATHIEQAVPYFTVENHTAAGAEELTITRGLSNNRIVINGHTEEPVIERIAVHEPARYAGLIFSGALGDLGIFVGDMRVEPSSETGIEIASWESEPLSELIVRCNKKSNNLYAELFALGGSGLSRHKQFSPRYITQFLFEMQKKPYYDDFLRSLPVAGVDGTLETRFVDTFYRGKILAKTGTLGGIATFVGYAHTSSGRFIAFAIMVQNHPASNSRAREAIDTLLIEQLDSL